MKKTVRHLPLGIDAASPEIRVRFKHRLQAVAVAVMALLFCAPAPAEKLQPQQIRTYSRLLKLLKEHQPQYNQGVADGQLTLAGASGSVNGAAAAQGTACSQTLVQVSGVDEADQVKNDGAYIYQLNQNRVLILRACPDAELGLVQTLAFTNGTFSPYGLFLDSQFLVVVGTAAREPLPRPLWRKWAQYFSCPQNNTVQARVYDITDPTRPRKVREIEVDGNYVGARKIGSTLYLVSRHYPQCYATDFRTSAARTLATPGLRDTRRGKSFRPLGPENCYYLPRFEDPNYLVVAGVDLENGSSTVKMTALLGAGEHVYASTENLYVTASRRFWDRVILWAGGIPTTGNGFVVAPLPEPSPVPEPMTDQTDIYKFSLAGGKPAFVSAGQVPGTVLNSYSMDENQGYLRVATTCRGWFGRQTNQVSVLDRSLNLTGKLENIAPGERIYAARFLGSRLFLVTFQQIDPLFAIDLSDPAHPVLAGQLTLPGFSNFLLPYDENHLIGLGKDVVAVPASDDPQFPFQSGIVYQQGVKLALFDVSDLTKPTLLDSLSIGDRGTDSPALQDPHALLFDPARNLLSFPLTVAQVASPDPAQPWQWGETVFQGAYVFRVSPEAGFELRGSITHLPAGAGVWRNWEHQITRVITMGDDLFTLSTAQVKANDLETLAEKAVLDLPFDPTSGLVISRPVLLQPVPFLPAALGAAQTR